MAIAQKGAISFGLVHIPVELYTATQDNNIRFNQLDKDSNSRVRYKKIAEETGRELKNDDIVKGYEYEKGKYIIISDAELEELKTEKDRSIRIIQFTDQCVIPPVYYDRPYYLTSQKGGEKAYELLCRAMLESGKVAIGKTVLGQSETMLALVPTDHGLLLVTLLFYDEIKEFPKEASHPELNPAEMKMAKQLIESLNAPFEPEKYKDEFQERLKELISGKIEGREITTPRPKEQPGITNLMDALKASLEQQGVGQKTAAPKARRKKAS